MIYGTAARGLPTDGPFDEDTGLGFVPQRSGHYSDALARGKKVIALVAEVFGGLSPHPARFLRQLSRGWPPSTPPATAPSTPAALARSDSTTGSASRTPSS